jgi:penicillin-binding protein 2
MLGQMAHTHCFQMERVLLVFDSKSADRVFDRIYCVLIGFLLFSLVAFFRLYFLQVKQGDLLSRMGEKNFQRTGVLIPKRGNLVDCNNNPLASNRPVFDLYWRNLAVDDDQKQQFWKVFELVGGNRNNSSLKISMFSKKKEFKFLLKSDIDFELLCKICEQFPNNPSIVIESRVERSYPYKSLASHVVGYLNRLENVGKSGLEKLFQSQLSGQAGVCKSVENAFGQKLSQSICKDAMAGNNIKLTIDLDLQIEAEELFEKNQSGIFLLMDPESGAVKAIVSYPNFDPNKFLFPMSSEEWQDECSLNNPLLNRVTQALYPPASLFKLVVVSAGLEEKIINPSSNFECKGYTIFGKRKYWCQQRWGHGILDTKEGLAQSCNIHCFEIAKKLSIDTLACYARGFGLGKKTGFLLGEKSGLIPSSEWKAITKGESWLSGDTLSAGIGQSYLLVTPIQIARMVSSICSGYLVKPRILEEEEIEKKKLFLSDETIDFLRSAMGDAVMKGTVWRLRKFQDFQIFAKTGTAQTCSLNVKKVSRAHYEHAWLAGFFKYKNEKPLSIVVIMEHAGQARPAVKMAERFLKKYKNLCDNKVRNYEKQN